MHQNECIILILFNENRNFDLITGKYNLFISSPRTLPRTTPEALTDHLWSADHRLGNTALNHTRQSIANPYAADLETLLDRAEFTNKQKKHLLGAHAHGVT